MATKLWLGIALIASLTACLRAEDNWVKAEKQIKYLRPSSLRDLPDNLASALESRGCRIPQHGYPAKSSKNVIRGEFQRRGQTDWAVLCSTRRLWPTPDTSTAFGVPAKTNGSSILVFWNGSEKNPAEIAPMADRDFLLHGIGNNRIVFSRVISVVGAKFIIEHSRAGPKPPSVTHDAIDDAFLEKASIVHYFYKGRWLQLAGSD